MIQIKENNRVREELRYDSLTHERKCRQCGKIFYTYCRLPEYAYKRNSDVFCTWSCMREWDKTHSRRGTRGRPRKVAL